MKIADHRSCRTL